jgi:hypothetical protein
MGLKFSCYPHAPLLIIKPIEVRKLQSTLQLGSWMVGHV